MSCTYYTVQENQGKLAQKTKKQQISELPR